MCFSMLVNTAKCISLNDNKSLKCTFNDIITKCTIYKLNMLKSRIFTF